MQAENVNISLHFEVLVPLIKFHMLVHMDIPGI